MARNLEQRIGDRIRSIRDEATIRLAGALSRSMDFLSSTGPNEKIERLLQSLYDPLVRGNIAYTPGSFYALDSLLSHKILPKDVNPFGRFRDNEISYLSDYGISPRMADPYDSHFSVHEIVELIQKGASPEQANSYDPRVETSKIIRLIRLEIAPEQTKYIESLSAKHVNAFLNCGMFADKLSEEQQEIFSGIPWISFSHIEGAFLGAGKQGLVFSHKKDNESFIASLRSDIAIKLFKASFLFASKIGPDIDILRNEYKMLEKIDSYHRRKQKNIVKLKEKGKHNEAMKRLRQKSIEDHIRFCEECGLSEPGEFEGKIFLPFETEFIYGESLRELLEKECFKPENVLKYARDICNGIYELRQAGIYHWDLHDDNILIDEDNNRAVIIDLGLASDDPSTTYRAINRTYGCANDLQTLGILMYQMATGDILFDDNVKGLERDLDEFKDSVKELRTRTYANGENLVRYISHKMQNIKDKRLKQAINYMLDDNLTVQAPIDRVEAAKTILDSF